MPASYFGACRYTCILWCMHLHTKPCKQLQKWAVSYISACTWMGVIGQLGKICIICVDKLTYFSYLKVWLICLYEKFSKMLTHWDLLINTTICGEINPFLAINIGPGVKSIGSIVIALARLLVYPLVSPFTKCIFRFSNLLIGILIKGLIPN